MVSGYTAGDVVALKISLPREKFRRGGYPPSHTPLFQTVVRKIELSYIISRKSILFSISFHKRLLVYTRFKLELTFKMFELVVREIYW